MLRLTGDWHWRIFVNDTECWARLGPGPGFVSIALNCSVQNNLLAGEPATGPACCGEPEVEAV